MTAHNRGFDLTDDIFSLLQVTPPAAEPILLQEAKDHIRYTQTDQDSVVSSLITRVRAFIENTIKRQLITATWKLGLGEFPLRFGSSVDGSRSSDAIRLPRPPLISVDSIVYLDENGVSQTLPMVDFRVDALSEPGRIVPAISKVWPATLLADVVTVEVTYQAGFGPVASDVPEPIKHAMLLLIGHWWEHREAVIDQMVPQVLEVGLASILSTEMNTYVH